MKSFTKPLLLILLIGAALFSRAEDITEKDREVDKLLTHLGYDESLPRMLGSINRIFKANYKLLNIPDEIWDEIAEALTYEEIRAMSAKLYAQRLTLVEIKAANAFYDSEIGRTYAKKVAEIGEQEFIETREWGKKKAEMILIRYLKAKELLKEPANSKTTPASKPPSTIQK